MEEKQAIEVVDSQTRTDSDAEKAEVIHVEAVPVASVPSLNERREALQGEDPLAAFSQREIRRTWMKVDVHILPVAVLLYFSSYIARTNLANANVLGMGEALSLTANQYNLALSIFFVGYVLFETPSNIIIRRINARVYISAMALIWGLICSLTAVVKNSQGLMAARFFLGLAEAGFLPGIILWMGSWYPRPMQGRRFSVLYCTVSLTGAFGGLLATGINTLDGKRGIAGWRWIFLIEGAISIVLGIYTFVFFSSSPTTSVWLKPRERQIILLTNEIDRALRADEPFSASQIKSAFTDWRMYLWGLMYWMNNVPVYSVILSLPVVVTGLGYTGTTATLFAVWPYFVGFGAVAVTGYTLDRYGHRFAHYCVGIIVASTALIVLIIVESLVVRYVMYFFVMFMFLPITTMWSWLAQNVAGSNKRAAATGFTLSMANVGGIVGGQLYRAEWAPRYVQGHAINLACYVVALVAGTVMWLSYKRDNAARDRAEGIANGGANVKQRREGMLGMDLGDLGDRDPRYRYYL